MSVRFEPERIAAEFNDDPEFRLHARYWNGVLEFGVGDRAYELTMTDGSVSSVIEREFDPAADGSDRVKIHAPAGDWEIFVQDPAPPFYLDYYSASHHHGFNLGGDEGSLWAYYPAIRRTADLFRRIAVVEGV